MFWATRLIVNDEWLEYLSAFEAHWQLLRYPRDMLLMAANETCTVMRLFVGVPRPEDLLAYSGFEQTERIALPRAPILLAGRHEVYQAMFQTGG
ncbi:hypothetical protein [Methylobacterium oxalidis]|uniref:Uncharacterized protein n=1 Tax=Methylobacterium oxalidis TaxID=944322 RepID=A0A512JB32_9HYPH|nr:hypothetical protein [Methylobacterium oxalidis]GEP07190.1 hypothetical protein MOX02_52280 [Methylobacterium oxalidis]GJE34897.1 hypothetical protein LDDCCGHA_5112 [Methylobacterium oxalidis]GLS66019.1 hypothetical protein GCM10007888_44010 [Methylobacterium oxalidis]